MEGRAGGARKASRRAPRPQRSLDPQVLALAGGTAAAAIAWAALVYGAIRFGQSGRGGQGSAWIFMTIAALGAVACLFLALMLGSRVLRAFGVTPGAQVRSVVAKGGRRTAGKRSAHRH